MAQIQSPETYADGQQVTAARLNNQTNGAILLPGAVTDQVAISGGVASADAVIVHDASASALRKVTAGELLGGGVPVVASSVTGVAGSDLILAGASGQNVEVSGNLDVTGNEVITGGLTVTGNTTLDAGLNVNGLASFNVTSAVKIPVGTTGQRPGTPVAGQMRYNSTLDQAEVYSGTEWKAVGGSPFDASGGVITTIDGYRIHTYTVSGTFTPSLTREGKVEVLVVGAGGAGAFVSNPGGGGGGGGDVKTGFINIAKNTSPMTVVVGTGVTGTGSSSSFGSITSNGGGPGSGLTGGTSGSGITGGSGNSAGAGGGAGAQTTQTFRWTDAGGVGGQGFGSSISGTLRMYGGGGGGASTGSGKASAPGLAGGGGQGVAPVANSGGGGSGGSFSHGSTLGADGIVIIRYRVS
jgi:hypothetical protein